MRSLAITAAALLACSSAKESGQNGTPTAEPPGPRTAYGPSKDAEPTSAKPMSKHEQAYADLVKDVTKPELETREAAEHAIGSWRFFRQKHQAGRGPGAYRHHAAVDDAGHVVSPMLKQKDWNALLSTEGLDANGALARIAWLYRSIPFSLDEKLHGPIPNAAVRAVVRNPVLEKRDGGTVVFRGWMSTPPNVEDPSLVVIEAPPTGAASISFTPWSKVK